MTISREIQKAHEEWIAGRTKEECEDDDLMQALDEINEIVDSGMYYRKTQAIVEGALSIIREGKITKGTFEEYIELFFRHESNNEEQIERALDNEVTPEDCLFFFKQHGFKIIE